MFTKFFKIFRKKGTKDVVRCETNLELWDLERLGESWTKDCISRKVIEKCVDKLVNDHLEYEIKEEAKNMLYELLESDDFKTGLKETIKENFRNSFKQYLESMSRRY